MAKSYTSFIGFEFNEEFVHAAVYQDGSPIFSARDAAAVLEYEYPGAAVVSYCCDVMTLGEGVSNAPTDFISLFDAVQLARHSASDHADAFEQLVLHEIVPSLLRSERRRFCEAEERWAAREVELAEKYLGLMRERNQLAGCLGESATVLAYGAVRTGLEAAEKGYISAEAVQQKYAPYLTTKDVVSFLDYCNHPKVSIFTDTTPDTPIYSNNPEGLQEIFKVLLIECVRAVSQKDRKNSVVLVHDGLADGMARISAQDACDFLGYSEVDFG